MNRHERSVRFRDFLSLSGANCLSPAPMISPSVQFDPVDVVHSIFSPSYITNLNRSNNPSNYLPKYEYLDQQMEILASHQDSKPPLWKTPHLANRPYSKQKQANMAVSENQGTSSIVSTNCKKTPISKLNDTPKSTEKFFTPAMSLSSLSATPFTEMIRNNNYAFETLLNVHGGPTTSPFVTFSPKEFPISLLSFPNIQKCNSIQELKPIIDILEKRETEYPTLLRLAKRRMSEICKNDEYENVNIVPTKDAYDEKKTEESPLKDSRQINMAESLRRFESPAPRGNCNSKSSLMMSLSTDNGIEQKQSSTIRKTVTIKPVVVHEGDRLNDSSKFASASQNQGKIRHLNGTIAEMEKNNAVEHSDFTRKIDALQKANHAAEMKLKNIEAEKTMQDERGIMDQQHLLPMLEELRLDRLALEKKLSAEQRVYNQRHMKAMLLEENLTKEIKQLQERVANARTDSQNQSRSMQQKHMDLNRLLRSAQRNLEDVKKERDGMILVILQILGEGHDSLAKDFHNLSVQQRHEVFRKCNLEFERLKRSDAESSDAARRELKARRDVEQKLDQTMSDMKSERQCNIQLASSIEHLRNELVRSRKHYDELLLTVEHRHLRQMEQVENRYRMILHSMSTKMDRQQNKVRFNEENLWRATKEIQTVDVASKPKTHGSIPIVRHSVVQAVRPEGSILSERSHHMNIGPTQKLNALNTVNPKGASIIHPKNNILENTYFNVQSKENFSDARHAICTDNNVNKNERVPLSTIKSNMKQNHMNTDASKRQLLVSFATPATSKPATPRSSLVKAAGGRKGLVETLKKIRVQQSSEQHRIPIR